MPQAPTSLAFVGGDINFWLELHQIININNLSKKYYNNDTRQRWSTVPEKLKQNLI